VFILRWANNLNFSRDHVKIWNTEWPNVFLWVCARIWWLHNELIPNPRKLQWWLAACNYLRSVGDTWESLSINNKCNKTMQVWRSSNCLQSILQRNQSMPFAHLQSCKLQVKAHWWNHGRIQQEIPHDELFISISITNPRFKQFIYVVIQKPKKLSILSLFLHQILIAAQNSTCSDVLADCNCLYVAGYNWKLAVKIGIAPFQNLMFHIRTVNLIFDHAM